MGEGPRSYNSALVFSRICVHEEAIRLIPVASIWPPPIGVVQQGAIMVISVTAMSLVKPVASGVALFRACGHEDGRATP